MVSLAKLERRGLAEVNTRGLLLIFCLQLHFKSGENLKVMVE